MSFENCDVNEFSGQEGDGGMLGGVGCACQTMPAQMSGMGALPKKAIARGIQNKINTVNKQLDQLRALAASKNIPVPNVEAVYVYLNCLKARLLDAAVKCNTPSTSVVELIGMVRKASVRAKADARQVLATQKRDVRQTAAVARKEVRQGVQAERREQRALTTAARVVKREAAKEARRQKRLKNGKVVSTLPVEDKRIEALEATKDKLAAAIVALTAKLAAKKANSAAKNRMKGLGAKYYSSRLVDLKAANAAERLARQRASVARYNQRANKPFGTQGLGDEFDGSTDPSPGGPTIYAGPQEPSYPGQGAGQTTRQRPYPAPGPGVICSADLVTYADGGRGPSQCGYPQGGVAPQPTWNQFQQPGIDPANPFTQFGIDPNIYDAQMALPPPSLTVPKNCQGRRASSPRCMFFTLTLETQKQMYFLIQQITQMQGVLMQLIQQLMAGGTGGGAAIDPETGYPYPQAGGVAIDPTTGYPYQYPPAGQQFVDPYAAPSLVDPSASSYAAQGSTYPTGGDEPAMVPGAPYQIVAGAGAQDEGSSMGLETGLPFADSGSEYEGGGETALTQPSQRMLPAPVQQAAAPIFADEGSGEEEPAGEFASESNGASYDTGAAAADSPFGFPSEGSEDEENYFA